MSTIRWACDNEVAIPFAGGDPLSFHRSRNRGIKLGLYDRHGVAEYWIVDPEAEVVEACRLEKGARCERLASHLLVRIGGETVGEIEHPAIFRGA